MVADFLRVTNMDTLRVWLTPRFLWTLLCALSIVAGPSLSFAQLSDLFPRSRGPVSEEDLPPKEIPMPTMQEESFPMLSSPTSPRETLATDPVPLPSAAVTPREMAVTAPSLPTLPPNTGLAPQEVVALRFVEVGKALWEQGDLGRAQEQFERAMSIAPLQPYSYYFLGRITFSRGEHKQALAFLRKAELSFRRDIE